MVMERGKEKTMLKRGYTTGSCAAAAATAAAALLFQGEKLESVSFRTPDCTPLELKIEHRESGNGWARCAVKKYSGDDPDITNGILVCACVSREPEKEGEGNWEISRSRWYVQEGPGSRFILYLGGGEGIGCVTRPGLNCPVGMHAINPVPRKMIFDQISEICREADVTGPVWITLEIPDGRRLAEKTFNPRLGIIGGLSVLGTSGIVEPMSEPALIETIHLEILQRAAQGERHLLLTPGNYGEYFLSEKLGLPLEKAVKCSNYLGNAFDMAVEAGMESILLIGHAGKLIKLAAGVMNTHSKIADGRMQCLAAYCAACGTSAEMVRSILSCITVEEALELMEQETGLREQASALIMERIAKVLHQRTGGKLRTEVVIFTNQWETFGKTSGADALIRRFALNE